MNGSRRLLFACLLLAAVPAVVRAETDGELALTGWEGSMLGRRIGGTVAVLVGVDGSLRWEIAAAPDTSLTEMLARRGRGWTVVAGPDGRGTLNAWGEEWRTLEEDVARVLAAATQAALAADVPRSVVVRGEAPTLRERLAQRGTGRGGPGETLRLAPAAAGATVMTSSRRPGSLRLDVWRRLPVRYPVRESFVPLWPLLELLEFPDENGNPGD